MKNLEEKIGYIYKITSPNGKIYIGQTLNPIKRKSDYKNKNFKQQIKLWNNCEFYKWNPAENFEIIDECLCGIKKLFLNEKEIFWIDYYDSFQNGLNCNSGGHGNLGYKFSEKSLEKMSKSKLGVKHSEERNKQKSLYTKGRTHSEETKQQMSSTKKSLMDDDLKERIRLGNLGKDKSYLLGNEHSNKKVVCETTGKVYNSLKEAASDLNLHSTNISQVCKGKAKQTKGYKFKYYEEKENSSFDGGGN